MTKRKTGIFLIVSSIFIWVIERTSLTVSNFLGKLYCGDQYMKPIGNIIGDMSCGFNADMYLTVFLFVVILIGIALLLISKKTNKNI
jgi:drug/metabolite transporter superfamily protein YnfA